MNARKSEKRTKINRKGWKIWSFAGLLLLVAALLLVLYNNWESRLAGERSAEVIAALEEQIPEPAPAGSDAEENRASSGGEDAASENREMPTIEIDGYRYIGYLECPSIHLKLPVMEEWDYTRLKTAPCRYSGSVYKNDMVIAGHNYARHFSPLRWQKIGTEINFIDAEGILYPYEISDIEILNPTSIREMTQDSKDWDLTLFTCTIGGQSRYTIRCVRTDGRDNAEG
ncbi:sortase [Bilifractor porci]|uniref:Sortase n=1 Tax=Bilifractor porci TaxID=2606636 RepID=A0A7X2P6F5_9FIRM|nr:sortase [Bilifractor porci]MST81107.1 sortase [Bilifractor porci]